MRNIIITGICLILGFTSQAQFGRVLNKMADKAIDKALGTEDQNNTSVKKEPDCATPDAKIVYPFEKNLKMDVSEITVKVMNGNILLYNKATQKYYIKNKNSENPAGPYNEEDPKVRAFSANEPSGNSDDARTLAQLYPEFIKVSGGKYTIQFAGKSYGPFDLVDIFMVNASKTKFIARTTQSLPYNEKEVKEMENKSQQEQMQMAMQMAQKMMQNTGGDPTAMMPKYISNISGITEVGNSLAIPNNTVKYDEIVWVAPDKIVDLSGKTLLTINRQKMNTEGNNLWISSDNSKWATLMYGRLIFSDGKECKEIFAPYVAKENGKTVLNYLYFSPKNNAIMEASFPF